MATTTTIRVTPEKLESAAARIYKSQYDSLYHTTEDLATKWQGKDNQAFVDKINEFKKDFNKMYESMNDYADVLKKIAGAYRDAQQHVVTDARNIQNTY